jgi:cell fate regulator YaaT (PSP1 superfamily)
LGSHAVRDNSQESVEKSAQRQLLDVIEHNSEIIPKSRSANPLTVEEAEQLLSELAKRGQLDVRVEGSRLVYAL